MAKVEYVLLDPAKNYTILVKSPVKKEDRIFVASVLMKEEPLAEQVGFISGGRLDMAGGEFCGNATRCAAYITGEPFIVCAGQKIRCEGTAAYIPKDLKGINHYIFEEEISNPAEKARELSKGLDAAGLMFWNEEKSFLKPLVYVPAVNTLFWENSCASGTAALANFLCEKKKKKIDMDINEPGGVLHISTDPDDLFVKLDGKIVILKEGEICIPERNC